MLGQAGPGGVRSIGWAWLGGVASDRLGGSGRFGQLAWAEAAFQPAEHWRHEAQV